MIKSMSTDGPYMNKGYNSLIEDIQEPHIRGHELIRDVQAQLLVKFSQLELFALINL